MQKRSIKFRYLRQKPAVILQNKFYSVLFPSANLTANDTIISSRIELVTFNVRNSECMLLVLVLVIFLADGNYN